MPKNKITDLRNHLFAALEKLQDEENPMDVERALAIAKVSQVVIDSAKVEVSLINVVGGIGPGSDFFERGTLTPVPGQIDAPRGPDLSDVTVEAPKQRRIARHSYEA